MTGRLAKNPVYSWLSHRSYELNTLLSPRWNSRRRFYKIFGRPLDEGNPVTWSEKLMVLKLNDYNANPLVRQCANKFFVRAYVEKCGLSRLLIPCIGLWEDENAVCWDALPEQFVLKSTMGCGSHVFCRDKRTLDVAAAKKKLHYALHCRYDLAYAELQYRPGRDMHPQVVGEALIDGGDGRMLADYKLFCFHGEPQYVLYCFDRDATGHASYLFLDTDWRIHPELHPCNVGGPLPPRPDCLDDMLACARTLAAPFPFVRADFYEHDGKPLFGELTFTPSACLDAEVTPLGQQTLGKLIDLKRGQGET